MEGIILNTENARAFNLSLKKTFEEIGVKVRINITNSYKFPNCYVTVRPENEFENNFRLKVFDTCQLDRSGLLNVNNVSWGNIQANSIAIKVHQWVNVFTN